MTLIPFQDRQDKVKGVEGPTYQVGPCAHPHCQVGAVERHHLCRRSFLGGPFDWVEYEGVMIQNVVGLCGPHHKLVTENRAWILWSELGFFHWVENNRSLGKLSPQPSLGGDETDYEIVPEQVMPDVCPTCLRPHKRKHEHMEEKRPRVSWSIHIPKDERENGAEVLDTLLEEARKLMARAGLPYGDEASARYFVLAAVLGLFVQHAKDVMSDA